MQQARGHTEGVLAFVVYEGCGCREHDYFGAMAVAERSRHGKHEVATCGSSDPETQIFEQTDVIVKDWERQYAVAAELPAVAKLAQDAVAVRTSTFHAVPFFERAPFPAQVPSASHFHVKV